MALYLNEDRRTSAIYKLKRHRIQFFVLTALIGSSLLIFTATTLRSNDNWNAQFVFLEEAYARPAETQTKEVTVSTLPIYLIQPPPADFSSAIMSWGTLASSWDRNSTFDDLTQQYNSATSSFLPSIPSNFRVAIIIHCSPKMGSLTLRNACRRNLQDSCGLQSRLTVDPNGYWNITEFGEIIRKCTATNHFCLRSGMFKPETERFDATVFFHLYPFRNYDAWTRSALKEAFDKGEERGCNDLRKMMGTCTDNHGELAFFKYPKTKMSEVQPLVVHRMNEMKEIHHTILYPFREIDGVLSMLSKEYQIPLLPGSNGTDHTAQRNARTCDQSILDKFHECFTSNLMTLT